MRFSDGEYCGSSARRTTNARRLVKRPKDLAENKAIRIIFEIEPIKCEF